MEEKPQPKTPQEDGETQQEQPLQRTVPPAARIEPPDEAGDAPCWAHLLDEEGQLS
jgi:hypothetical protein